MNLGPGINTIPGGTGPTFGVQTVHGTVGFLVQVIFIFRAVGALGSNGRDVSAAPGSEFCIGRDTHFIAFVLKLCLARDIASFAIGGLFKRQAGRVGGFLPGLFATRSWRECVGGQSGVFQFFFVGHGAFKV